MTCGISRSFFTGPTNGRRFAVFCKCGFEVMRDRFGNAAIYLMSVDWLATHCQVSFSRIQVSVKRP